MDEVDDILDQDPIVEEEEEEEEEDEMEIDEEGQDDDEAEAQDEDDEDEDDDDDDEDENDEDEEDDQDQDKDKDDKKLNTETTSDEEKTEKDEHNEDKHSPAPMEKLHHYYLSMLQAAKIAFTYNIYPTAAIPIQTHVNAMTMSKGLKYLFLGGSDGYIRKYDFLNTLQGKLSLTIIQKHSLTESITNAGILTGYWENEIPQYEKDIQVIGKSDYQPIVSPVYSLAVEDECMYMLSGLKNGGISMQGVRYMEGSIIHYFKEHTQVVNLLKFNQHQDKFLSGSWDKRIIEWDLNNGGKVCNEFKGNNSEISSMEYRPLFSSADIKDIMSKSNNNNNTNKLNTEAGSEEGDDEMGSLFGEDDDEEEEKDAKIDEEKDKIERNPADEISSTSLNIVYDESTLMTSGLNGIVHLWDKRDTTKPMVTLERGPGTPPWCMSATWDSQTGDKIYVGRRNACVEEYDLKMATSQPTNAFKLPSISGPVSCVQSMPNGKHILIASRDNIRLFDTTSSQSSSNPSNFLIVPGHHGGIISNLYIDPTCRYLVSTSGDRGWQGQTTDTVLIYDIDLE
ncbi:transcription factor Spt8p [Monosporozyma unispora]|mgnify:CR=1 FL=1|nr:Transcription factor spt8 [Kazachstania unispora]